MNKVELKKIKCVIFDVDGTLLDSMGMWNSITYEYADYKKINAPEGLSRRMNSLSLTGCAELYRELGVKGTVEEIADEIVEMAMERYRHDIKQKKGAREFMALLRENGIHIAVATASAMIGLIPALEREGLSEFIEYAKTCEDIGKSKSEPDLFLNCASHFGLNPRECVVVEDALYAAKTAKKAGFSLIVVDDDCHCEEDKEELKALCNRYIYDFEELILELKEEI